jgi:threonine synthase
VTTAGVRLLERYREFLPVGPATPLLGLGEGGTPLLPAPRLGKRIGLPNLHVKVEGANPSGSFKDRGMVVAVAKAVEAGAQAIICASTGNTSASAAAYGASAGLEVVVVLPRGQVAHGKLVQARATGARIVSIAGNFDAAAAIARALATDREGRVQLVNSVNPHRIAGQQTAVFEICDQLGRAPDAVALPVGNAGNISAYWSGFRAYHRAGRIAATARMFGFQAAGAAPIVRGVRVADPQTVATAIRIGNPASWATAIRARDESGGAIDEVTDEEILQAYRDLAHDEGILCEPASAAGVAGLRKLVARERVARSALVVAVLTGNGIKDVRAAAQVFGEEVIEAGDEPAGIVAALGW